MRNPQTVGVLTFHRCINYGSYWQARALVEGLRRQGRAAVLLDHRSRAVDRAEWRNAFQPVLPQRTDPADRRAYGVKARRFLDAIAELPLSEPFDLDDPSNMRRRDVAVVGSDEVWNFRHPWYAARPLFFGEGLRADRVVAYAASFGCHDATAPLEADWAERLRRFSSLAVRDDNSRRLVEASLGQDPAIVLDPCLQFDFVCRRAEAGQGDYAVVYGHGFPPEVAAGARRWADAAGVRLVSVGYRNEWADDQRLDAGPEDFAQLMGGARSVVTNYFHGCVFALVNGKPFACTLTDYRWRKIVALLDAVGAPERVLGPEASTLDDLLATAPGADVRERIEALRARSSDYLRHALH